jgi:hypothetical protein
MSRKWRSHLQNWRDIRNQNIKFSRNEGGPENFAIRKSLMKYEKRVKRNRPKRAGNKPEAKPRWIRLRVRIVSTPKESCSIQRTDTVEPEVQAHCVIVTDEGATRYLVVFFHKRTLEMARNLKIGDLVDLEECKFQRTPGRRELAIRAKKATLITSG